MDRDEILRVLRAFEDEGYETVDAEIKVVEGVRVWVATPTALYRLKRDTVRPLDRQDAHALRQRFDIGED